MARYLVTAVVGISLSTVVEADTKDEAIDIAINREPTQFCAGAELDSGDEAWVTSGEIDCGDIGREEIVDVSEVE
jgi:hypothetical protein